jgi:K(+)-stimulated pyrophosphate-energized sodium pump
MIFPRPALRRAVMSVLPVLAALLAGGLPLSVLMAQESAGPAQHAGGEAALVLPNLGQATFLGGINGRTLLLWGLLVCALGLAFGLVIATQLKRLPVHRSMLEVSELIYETCKTYLLTQGRFLLILWVFIGIAVAVYFGKLASTVDASGAAVHGYPLSRVVVILLFSLIGMAGSYAVAWFGIRVNTYANSRAAFASLRGKPYPCYQIPLKAGMSIGMLLISIELVLMLAILLFIPGEYAGP